MNLFNVGYKPGNKNYEPMGFASNIAGYSSPADTSQPSQANTSELADQLTEIEGISGLDQDAKDSIKRQVAEQYYQKGPDLETFQTMLNKLTGSKMKQQGQVASARRGDIYAGGLANMMSNF